MAKRGKRKKIDFEKFIIESPYGTCGVYPYGVGATIVLSSVTIEFKKHPKNTNSQSYHDIYTNTKHKHAERRFLDDLRQTIDDLPAESTIAKIEVNLVQNYSPCNVADDERAYCADKILKFKNDMEQKKISFSLTIKFANFYLHYKKWNNEGLQKLVENNVTLEVFQGEDDWKAFLNNENFVDLTNDEKTELLKRATSDKREEREKVDKKILEDIIAKAKDNKGKQKTTKQYSQAVKSILIRIIMPL